MVGRLVGLKELALDSNKIRQLRSGDLALGQTSLLTSLSLAHNLLTATSAWPALRTLTALETLNLSGNRIDVIPDYALVESARLRELDLGRSCGLWLQIEPAWRIVYRCAYTKLGERECCNALCRNQISCLGSNALCGLGNLSVLGLKSNCIQAVDGGAFAHCEFLQELDLSDNVLRQVPDLSGMLYIQKLSCQDNRIQSLENLADISCTIRCLDLSFNCIQELRDLRWE